MSRLEKLKEIKENINKETIEESASGLKKTFGDAIFNISESTSFLDDVIKKSSGMPNGLSTKDEDFIDKCANELVKMNVRLKKIYKSTK